MKRSRMQTVCLWSLILAVPIGMFVSQASSARDVAAAVSIDKDFETCVRKFVSRRFYHRIDATEVQKEKLDAIWSATMDSTRPEREQLRRGLLELSDLMAQDDATDEQITQKAHELRALHEKIQDERLISVLKARKVLTQEQKKKLHDRLTDALTQGTPMVQPRRLGLMGMLLN